MKKRKSARVAVTNEERDLVFAIAEGLPELIHIIGQIRIISIDAQNVGYMEILRYLVREKLTGLNFWGWFREKHDGSVLRAIAFIRMKVHSDFAVRKIYAIKPI